MVREGFLGVPTPTFDAAGRQQLVALLEEGLSPESKVLEFGCGCLRIAYWLVHFLDPDCYFGIEPAHKRVELGSRFLFTPEKLADKRPRFDNNAVFDSGVFRERFDFFLARSIWTHACKRQIEMSLDSFVSDSKPDAIFLASFLPPRTPEDDYMGDVWVGTSHESDTPGVICQSLDWIRAQCEKRGLQVEELPGIDCDSQYWLRVRWRR